jgi:hypothetical protein
VTYTYEWGAHYTCQDMCDEAKEVLNLTGRIENGHAVFSVERQEERSTSDEL